MPVVKAKLAFLSSDQAMINTFLDHSPLLIQTKDLSNIYSVDLLIFDFKSYHPQTDYKPLARKKNSEFSKLVLVFDGSAQIPTRFLSDIKFDYYISPDQLTENFLFSVWAEQSQKAQDEAYLNLSAELNQQYETMKTELENKLYEKSKNLIESRRQIFEINSRVEILRKSLFATTEVKNLLEAERALNDLLVGFNVITWLKIFPSTQKDQLVRDLDSQLDSTYHLSPITIGKHSYVICFFKGDRRAFRKTDINSFNKMAEALQINLNRYNNLLSLQQSERLFDLAFHSSPHPIIVIDDDYHVFQSNLAAEKMADDGPDHFKCYELLFQRKSPCTGCHLGARFETQQGTETYAVQSSQFSRQIDSERSYWVHLYENISEQKDLEKKIQQTARLSELGLISSSIAHELNNPLGGIISYLQIMKMELPAGHPFLSDIEFLNDSANRMKKHIEDLLYFSRKEDIPKLERIDLVDLFQKNMDLMQMQLKKEHLIVSFIPQSEPAWQALSVLHFRSSLHLVFQFFLHKLKAKRQNKSNFNGLVEVKISQDQSHSYVNFSANLGPHDLKLNTNDLSLITLEKSILDQGFQLVISEPQPQWLQLLIKIPQK